jgi:RNA polymerase sigma-70 factor, ECF subfamily
VDSIVGSFCPSTKRRQRRMDSPAPVKLPFADDQRFVEALQNGDRDSQRRLFERHYQQVYRLMYRMVGERHVDDLTQQVFLRVFQKISQFAGRSAFSTWLYRLATNEALQFLRCYNRRTTQRYAAEPVDDRPSDHGRLDDREMLEHALAELDPDLRAIFLLREVEQLSYYEIAMSLDIAEGTVASRLNRARRLLGDLIAENR